MSPSKLESLQTKKEELDEEIAVLEERRRLDRHYESKIQLVTLKKQKLRIKDMIAGHI